MLTEGWRARGRHLRIFIHPGNGLVGVAASRAIGSKPRRNREKRRLRELLRACPLPKGLDVVAIAQTDAPNARFEDLRDECGALVRDLEARWAAESGSL